MRQAAPAGNRWLGRGTWVAVAVLALVVAVVGSSLLVRRLAAADAPEANTATLGGLTARLGNAGWLSMDGHMSDDQGGYQMPAAMMPGAPVGDDMRFGVPLTLVNTGDLGRQFNLVEEFFLRGGTSVEPRPVTADTFGKLLRLSPGSAVDGVLYFDTVVPGATDPPLFLEWQRGGDTVRLAIPRLTGGGQVPGHGHG